MSKHTMRQQKSLLKITYVYISLAFAAIVMDSIGILHPITDVFAGCLLLAVCYYIGKFGNA